MKDSIGPVRLSKLMAERGICSRREADEYIARGQVLVNGQVISELGTKVDPNVRIELGSEALKSQKQLVTVLLNKPIGYVSNLPEKGYEPAVILLTEENYAGGAQKPHVIPVKLNGLAAAGRLDIDSQGLMVFTQDGRLAKQLIGENSEIEKEYLVRVSGNLPAKQLELLRYGLELDEKKLKPAHVEWVNEDQLRFVLKEGRKRQIRRMCEAVGLRVLGLKRVRIGSIMLGDLPEGRWRFMDESESFSSTPRSHVKRK